MTPGAEGTAARSLCCRAMAIVWYKTRSSDELTNPTSFFIDTSFHSANYRMQDKVSKKRANNTSVRKTMT
jgi:hypothetical protein